MNEILLTQFFDLSSLNNSIFDQLASEGFVVVDTFLEPMKCLQLNDTIAELRQNSQLKAAQIGRESNLSRQPLIRGDLTHWLDLKNDNPIENSLIHDLEILQKMIARELFLPLKKWEAHFALYPPGTGYEMHYDQHRNQPHRLITFVLYLNPIWTDEIGGELVLYDKNEIEFQRVSPTQGKLILFQSAVFPHAVRPSSNDRQSLTGWFRNDT